MINKIDNKIDKINEKILKIEAKIELILQHICVEGNEKIREKKDKK